VKLCNCHEFTVTHILHVPWFGLRLMVVTALKVEAYRRNPAKNSSLYTGHFTVVLQSAFRLILAKEVYI